MFLADKHVNKRRRTASSKLQNCVTDRFLSSSADAVATTNAAENTKLHLRVDFFIPVLGAALGALESRFNTDCVTVIENIASVIKLDDICASAISKLCVLADIDSDLCVADAKHLLRGESFGTVYQDIKSLRELL